MTALRWVQGAKPFSSVGAHNHCMRICGPACSKHAKIIYLCCQSALSTSVYQNPPASLPAGLSDGLPIGMPIIGRRNADVHVLAASAAFEWAPAVARQSPGGSAEDDRCGCEGDGSSRWYSRSGHGQPYQAHKTGQRPRTAQGPSALHRFGLGCEDRGRDCAIVSERRHRGHFRRRSFGRADLQPRLTRRRLPRPSNAVITRQFSFHPAIFPSR
jgi:hypothetical protein